jgi:Aspartyl protease
LVVNFRPAALSRIVLLLLLVVVLMLSAPGARAACTIEERGTVMFAPVANRILVPLTINDIDATFVLDTGAARSLVTPEAARRLGLASDEWIATTMRGVGGIVEHPNADPRSLALGGVPLHRRTVTHDTSLTVGEMPGFAPPGLVVDGLLGRDLLSLFDLQFDIGAHRLTIYDVSGCSGRFVPWNSNFVALPAEMPMTKAMVVPMSVDGHGLRALLDTGATSSLILAPGMFRLGLTPEIVAHDPGGAAHGIGPQAPQMHRHRFSSWQVGPELEPNPTMWVAQVRVAPIVDALLGADWLLAQRRVWISFTTGQVFFER